MSSIVIKKYGNRRLYDTAASRYLNLEEIAALIRQGNEVTVVDAKTGQDLTRVTLTQIITEDAKDKPTGLPLELLRQLPHGNSVLLDVLVGTFVGDTAAYAGGRLFGRRQLAPSISPGKTVEGLVCGILGAVKQL